MDGTDTIRRLNRNTTTLFCCAADEVYLYHLDATNSHKDELEMISVYLTENLLNRAQPVPVSARSININHNPEETPKYPWTSTSHTSAYILPAQDHFPVLPSHFVRIPSLTWQDFCFERPDKQSPSSIVRPRHGENRAELQHKPLQITLNTLKNATHLLYHLDKQRFIGEAHCSIVGSEVLVRTYFKTHCCGV